MNKWILKDNNPHTGYYLSDEKNILHLVVDQPIPKILKSQKNVILIPNLKENESIEKTQNILTSNMDNEIETHNIMGFIGLDNDRLIITSRFDNDQQWFLQYLLKKVLKLTMINLDFEMNNKKSFLEFLPFLFPFYLKRALSKGLYKEYTFREYNDSNVKGTIDVKRHLKNNLPFCGDISYHTREFNYDNPVNQIIRHTIEYIKHQYMYSSILDENITKHYVNQIIDVTSSYHPKDLNRIIRVNKQRPIRNTFYESYNQLVTLCTQILYKEKVGLDEESYSHAWGILFDGAWLWEEYINLLVDDYYYHPKNRTKGDPQYLFESNLGLIFPDFIYKDENNRKIMDAKYKPQLNIRSDDYNQILSYLFRFDSNEGIFVYPEITDKKEIKELKMKIGIDIYNYRSSTRISPEVIVKKIPFQVPIVDSEEEFDIKMREVEKDFLLKVK